MYGHADHNLSPSLVKDMAEMNKAKFADHIKVFVIADWDASAQMDDGSPYPKGTEWYRVMGSGAEIKPYKTGPEKNLDDPAELTAAVKEILGANKADRYGIVMWNHGGAWEGGFGHDGQDGTANGKGMTAKQAADAIKAGLDAIGVKGDRPLEFLTFDTCLMAGVEIVMPFANLAKVYIANAEIDYGDGWEYTKVLELLNQSPDIAPIAFAQKENDIWNKHHLAAGVDDKLIRSHISMDTAHVAAFATAFKALVDAVMDSQTFDWELLGLATFRALPVYSKVVGNPTEPSTLRDVGQLLSSLSALANDDKVAEAAKATADLFDKLVIANSVGDLRKSQIGLHIYNGLAKEIQDSKLTAYETKAGAWEKATGWTDVLAQIAKDNDGKAPAVTGKLYMPDNPSASDLPAVDFEVKDKDVAQAKGVLLAANPEDKSKVAILGLLGMGLIDPGTWSLEWDGAVAGIAIGTKDFAPATVMPWIVGSKKGEFGAQILGVPGTIDADGDKASATVLFDASTGKSISVIINAGGQPNALDRGELHAGHRGGRRELRRAEPGRDRQPDQADQGRSGAGLHERAQGHVLHLAVRAGCVGQRGLHEPQGRARRRDPVAHEQQVTMNSRVR